MQPDNENPTLDDEYALGDLPRPKPRANAAKRVIRATRRVEAFKLRQSGQSYAAIAEHLGVHESTVKRWVMEAIRAMPQEEADDLRALELARLDAILAPQFRAALAGDGWAADRVLKIMERRARYLDLDGARGGGLEQVGALLDVLVNGRPEDQA